jgi:hypothetical protein
MTRQCRQPPPPFTSRLKKFKTMPHTLSLLTPLLFIGTVLCAETGWAAAAEFAIEQQADRLLISYAGRPVATYVFRDPLIPRPYFAHVHAPDGRQVTRNHPPLQGIDNSDHADLHPGIWLAFGDLSGGDFWRNKDRVVHADFIEPPAIHGDQAGFAVRNRYERADGTIVCQEVCKLTFVNTAFGYMLIWNSLFTGDREFYFGDQEEMGLGIRVTTPISVKQSGSMLDAEGRKNEKEIWGKSAKWCDYSGTVDGQRIGITLMCHPQNFRACWMHARDYGFLAANPFGRSAFGQGEPSQVVVKPGENLRLRYGLLLHAATAPVRPDLAAAYANYVKQSGE